MIIFFTLIMVNIERSVQLILLATSRLQCRRRSTAFKHVQPILACVGKCRQVCVRQHAPPLDYQVMYAQPLGVVLHKGKFMGNLVKIHKRHQRHKTDSCFGKSRSCENFCILLRGRSESLNYLVTLITRLPLIESRVGDSSYNAT